MWTPVWFAWERNEIKFELGPSSKKKDFSYQFKLPSILCFNIDGDREAKFMDYGLKFYCNFFCKTLLFSKSEYSLGPAFFSYVSLPGLHYPWSSSPVTRQQ